MSASTTTDSMPPNLTEAGTFPPHPSDLLIDLIAALLTPIFLVSTRGDPHLARLAAIETIHSYQVTNQADLISVLQIIALGLAAAQAACLSMTPDLPLPQVMRLFGYADRLNRSSIARGKMWREDRQPIKTVAAAKAPPPQESAQHAQAAAPSPEAKQKPAAKMEQSWVAALTKLTEMLPPMPGLDPTIQQGPVRRDATFRAKALNSVARDLLNGTSVPSSSFPLPSERDRLGSLP